MCCENSAVSCSRGANKPKFARHGPVTQGTVPVFESKTGTVTLSGNPFLSEWLANRCPGGVFTALLLNPLMRTVKADRDYSKRNFTRDFGIEWRVAVELNEDWVSGSPWKSHTLQAGRWLATAASWHFR